MKIFLKIFLYLCVFVVSIFLGQTIGGYFYKGDFSYFSYQELVSNPKFMMMVEIFTALFVILQTQGFLKFDKESFQNLGIKFSFNWSLQGFLLGGIFVALFFLLLMFQHQLKIKSETFNFNDFFFTAVGLFCAALVEEIVFRGYLLNLFLKNNSKIKALLISSIIFAVFHFANPNVGIIPILNIFLAGLVIGFAYLKIKNIWFVTFLHMGWNLVQTLVGFNVSGQDFYSILNFGKINNNIWTGGNFGFEGSILSIVSLVLIYFILNSVKTSKQNIS